ncbi:MAG: signal peptidase II [Bacteroidota bacterium]|nr:signal peptidase II [Bacteroidota bacterium]
MRILIVTFFIVIVDQISKIYVKGISIPSLGIEIPGMPYQSSINVYGNFFKITFIENPGMAFGLQIGGKLFLSLFTILATILLIFFLYKNRKEGFLLRLALALILGGAMGNLIDRVFYGKIYGYAPYFYGRVVDFLHFDFPNFSIFGKKIYSWPIFNVADIAVTIGFLLILFGYKKIFKETPVTPVTDNDNLLTPNTELIPNGNNVSTDELRSDLKPKVLVEIPVKTASHTESEDNELEKKID